MRQITDGLGLSEHVGVVSRDCNLLFFTRDAQGRPSQPLRTLFMQEMLRRGVLAPSFVVSFSHRNSDIDATLEAAGEALRIYRKALENGTEGMLTGRPVKPVFRPFA